MSLEKKRKFILNCIYYFLVAVIIYFCIKFLFAYLFPVIIGVIVTVFVQKPANLISEKFKIKRGTCALCLVGASYILIVFTVFFILYGICNGFAYFSEKGILKEFGNYTNTVLFNANQAIKNMPNGIGIQIEKTILSLSEAISKYLSSFAANTAKSAPMFITGTVVTIIASCYIAKDFDRFKASIKSVLPEKFKIISSEIIKLLKSNINRIVVGYLKLMCITFVLLSIGLTLLRVKYAIMLAGIIAIVDLLPIIGTGTILIPWGIVKVLFGDYYCGIGLLILYLIISFIRNVIEPKIIGKQIGLHPLIALLSVFVGLKLFGFIGIFAMPIAVILAYRMLENGVFDILLSKEVSGTVQ